MYKTDIPPVVYVDITKYQYRAEGFIHILRTIAGGIHITYLHVHQFNMVYTIYFNWLKFDEEVKSLVLPEA